MLLASHVSVTLGGKRILHDLSFSLEEGQWLMLVGPNGAGKSTFVRAVAQSIPYSGQILLNGRNLHHMKPAERARSVGILAQHNNALYGYTVEEVVALGRYARRTSFFDSMKKSHALSIDHALSMTGLSSRRRANILTLSGGELQRVFLAQVFAQNPDILILDEPANHLDLKYQQLIFDLISVWLKTPGRSVLSVVHDLSLARQYGTHALLLHEGRCMACGSLSSVFTADCLDPVYGMDVSGWMQTLLMQWQAPEYASIPHPSVP